MVPEIRLKLNSRSCLSVKAIWKAPIILLHNRYLNKNAFPCLTRLQASFVIQKTIKEIGILKWCDEKWKRSKLKGLVRNLLNNQNFNSKTNLERIFAPRERWRIWAIHWYIRPLGIQGKNCLLWIFEILVLQKTCFLEILVLLRFPFLLSL